MLPMVSRQARAGAAAITAAGMRDEGFMFAGGGFAMLKAFVD